jgi:hypothetical protein
VQRSLQDAGHRLPASRSARSRLDAWDEAGYHRTSGESQAAAGGSSVMRDAREVAARRKRQLGRHRA